MTVSPAIHYLEVTPFRYQHQDAIDKNQTVSVVDLRHQGKMFRLDIRGELLSNGILVSEYGQSLPLVLPEQDQVALANLALVLDNVADFPFVKGYDILPVIKNETFYLKLKKNKDGKYRGKIDFEVDPEHPEKSNLQKGDMLTATVEVKVWLNLKEETAGFMFELIHLKNERVGEKPPAKKRK